MYVDKSKITGLPADKYTGLSFINNEIEDCHTLDDEAKVVLFRTLCSASSECDVYPVRYDGEPDWSVSVWSDIHKGWCAFLHHVPVQELTCTFSDMLAWAKASYENNR